MYAEEELAFMLDLQADPQAMRRRILPNQPAPSVVVQSQFQGPKKSGPGAFIVTLAVLFAIGLLLGFAR